MSEPILVVHIGAGNQSLARKNKYIGLIKKSLSTQQILNASQVLERSSLTNTGYGSALNLEGEVECDSSYVIACRGLNQVEMGAFYNVRHEYPISETIDVWHRLNQLYQPGGKLGNVGLSRPVLVNYDLVKHLVSSRADIESGSRDLLVSPKNMEIYRAYKDKGLVDYNQDVTDTIGLIEIKSEKTSIMTSSGGNFFKLPGRIGCAGVIGAAISHRVQDNHIAISCMCSGNGEDIIMMSLARSIADGLIQLNENGYDYAETMVQIITQESSKISLTSVNNSNEKIVYVGAICVIDDLQTNKKVLVYCHSTESFFFGFQKGNNEPEVILSTLGTSPKLGTYCRGEFRI